MKDQSSKGSDQGQTTQKVTTPSKETEDIPLTPVLGGRKEIVEQQDKAFDDSRRLSENEDLNLSDGGDYDNNEQISKAIQDQKNIPLKDKIMMGALDKYQKYNRFPWKLVIHIILLIATTAQVFSINYQQGQQYRTHQIVFYNLFFREDKYTDPNMQRYWQIFKLADEKKPEPPTPPTPPEQNKLRQEPDPPSPYDDDDDEPPDSLIEIIEDSVNNYYNLTGQFEQTLDNYAQLEYTDVNCVRQNKTELQFPNICPVQLDIQFLKSAKASIEDMTLSISPDDLWLFDEDRLPELKQFVQKISGFSLTYKVKVDYPQIDSLENTCYIWQIQQKFDFTNRGILRLTLNLNQVNCGQISDFINQTSNAITCAIVLILSIVSMVLQLTYFQSMSKMYKNIRQKYIDKEKELYKSATQNHEMSFQRIQNRNLKYMTQVSFKMKDREQALDISNTQAQQMAEKSMTKVSWEDLRFSEKAKLFSYWSIIIVVSNLFQMMGSLMCLLNGQVPLPTLQIFVGLGCALCWFSASKFIEHSPHLSFFSRTIHHAGQNIIRHGINMIPFFAGFAMLGLSIFWPAFRFRSAYVAFFSLFSIMLGDEISNSFMEVIQFDSFFGPIYMFLWVFLSMSVLMNIFIVIVGESFEIVQNTHKFNWLTDERFLQIENAEREFDDTSSESTSTDSDENPDLSQQERPLKKKFKSVRALKQIIELDYTERIGGGNINSINERSIMPSGTASFDEDRKITAVFSGNNRMMQSSHEGEFEMNFDDGKGLESAKRLSSKQFKEKAFEDSILLQSPIVPEEPPQAETDSSPSECSLDEQEIIEREFSKSFQDKIPTNVKDIIVKIEKLKKRLTKEVSRCVRDINKDTQQFNQSVRLSIQTGLVNDQAGDKSLKQTNQNIKSEIIKIQTKMYQLQSKLHESNESEEEQKQT